MTRSYLILLVISFLLFSCKKTDKLYHDSGQLKTIGKVNSQGDWDGTVKKYYDNGDIQFIGEFSDGKMNGQATWYYHNEKINLIEEYKDGLLNGIVQFYDTSGYKYQETKYIQDKKISYQLFDTLGQVMTNFVYLDTTNLPKMEDVQIRFSKDTSKIVSTDTFFVDIRIPDIPMNQLYTSITNSRHRILFEKDSFNYMVMPIRPGRSYFLLYIQINDTDRYEIYRMKYQIK